MHSNRRKWLLLCLGGVSAATCGIASYRRGQTSRSATDATVTQATYALGTKVQLTVFGATEARGRAAIDAAFAELETVERTMSLYRPNSQICELNRQGILNAPHPYLVQTLREAEATSRISDGAFDVTVQSLWEAFAVAGREQRLPTNEEIAHARETIDWRKVHVSEQFVKLGLPGMKITLNGIAQGFAADRVEHVLKQHGVEHALIDTGELGSLGNRPDGKPWTVGIQHPREEDGFAALTGLSGRALATSGDYRTRFSDDYSSHHIFDPHTGHSPTELASVSIVAPTALQADALSTAAMVLGADATWERIVPLPGIDVFLIGKDGSTRMTAGFPEIDPA